MVHFQQRQLQSPRSYPRKSLIFVDHNRADCLATHRHQTNTTEESGPTKIPRNQFFFFSGPTHAMERCRCQAPQSIIYDEPGMKKLFQLAAEPHHNQKNRQP
ncbi:hypothetical protein CEXT_597131 [Caerostris extrusa]|uniref:Uncharacterized protein n=1 Tax=Caerostris extrusa TaxID=172846 RepID=A0AAV4U8J4_CAEEX|nr:hypothetical protein CEXT_597131 [Caerostris extrusa]